MPKRIIRLSRTEPARTILLIVAFLTALMQVAAFFIPGTFEWLALPNTVLVAAVCIWGFVSAVKNHVSHMATSSFWVFVMWLWSGLSRLMFSPEPSMLLWAPFIILASALGVVYIYLSGQKKATGV